MLNRREADQHTGKAVDIEGLAENSIVRHDFLVLSEEVHEHYCGSCVLLVGSQNRRDGSVQELVSQFTFGCLVKY
jgi:hypothetical protein